MFGCVGLHELLELIGIFWLNLSGILDHVIESGAHLRPSFPGLPHDLVGVVAERHPDALLVGSVVRDNAYALEVLHFA